MNVAATIDRTQREYSQAAKDFLARHGIPCPAPIANLRDQYLGSLNGKPAAGATKGFYKVPSTAKGQPVSVLVTFNAAP